MRRLCFLILLAAAGCKPPAPPHGGYSQGGPAGGALKRAFPVEVQEVVTEEVQYAIDAVGSLEPQEEVKVTARVAGTIERISFEEGTKVTVETALVEIDRSRYRLLADRAKASHERATAEAVKAETVLQNRRELKKKDSTYVGDEEISTLTSQLNAARAAAAEAKSSLDLALQDLEYSQARSLVAGTINTKNVSTGQYVAAGTLLATLVDQSKLKLRFKVSETESVKLSAVVAAGRRISFSVRPLPGKTFQAELLHISPQANPQTRTVECLALVENRDTVLKPGFFAMVRAVVETRQRAVVVADSGILPTERGFVAFVVKEGKAHQRSVRAGLFVREGAVEILEGLVPGDLFVVTGASALREGVDVAVRKPGAVPAKKEVKE